MVKNFGGNKTKRDARKHIIASSENKGELRLINEIGETYAVVKKILGGGLCNITCLDGKTRLCVIRNKFKGRGKSNNIIEAGVWILAGIREWEVRKSGEKTCDLLHVYSNIDKEMLLQKSDINFNALLCAAREVNDKDSNVNVLNNVDIDFAVDNNKKYEELFTPTSDDNIGTFTNGNVKNLILTNVDNEFNIDEI